MTSPASSVQAPTANRDGASLSLILDRVTYCVEAVSLGFDRWDDAHAKGPGLYIVVERGPTAESTEPMGANHWPVADCSTVFDEIETVFEATREVAYACDGAVVVHPNGRVEEQMVRLKQLGAVDDAMPDTLPYEDWMGARHMSALETSTRESVYAVVTLSEEDGRMSIFRDGTCEDCPHDELWDEWQAPV